MTTFHIDSRHINHWHTQLEAQHMARIAIIAHITLLAIIVLMLLFW